MEGLQKRDVQLIVCMENLRILCPEMLRAYKCFHVLKAYLKAVYFLQFRFASSDAFHQIWRNS